MASSRCYTDAVESALSPPPALPACSLFGLLVACVPSGAAAAQDLGERVEEVLAEHGEGVVCSLWLGGLEGEPRFELAADTPRACASSIKTAYLIELFAKYAGRLDETLDETLDGALPGAAEALSDPRHPAIVHFDEETQAEIREHLENATVRRVGVAMIRGTGVSNEVYNAAANLVTAMFGGPEGLTRAIHARDHSLSGLVVRRYMLAARDVSGDNHATAASLAAALRMLATGKVPGVDVRTVAAMRAVMRVDDHPELGAHYLKTGSLDSDPMVRILSGWHEKHGEGLVYVVIAEQPGPGDRERPAAGSRLGDTAGRLRELLLTHAAEMEAK